MAKINFKRGMGIIIALVMVFQLFGLMPLSASASGNVMEVTIGGITTGYTDFGSGWMAAAVASETTHNSEAPCRLGCARRQILLHRCKR